MAKAGSAPARQKAGASSAFALASPQSETTVSAADRLPRPLVADATHSTLVGEEVSLAATAGGGCCLGMALAPSAGIDGLTAASGVFRGEVHPLDPQSRPETVNTAGWQTTRAVWRALFPRVDDPPLPHVVNLLLDRRNRPKAVVRMKRERK